MNKPRPSQIKSYTGVAAIAAAYVYFLLYAQFGFVSYLKLFFPDPLFTEKCMGLMGAGGLLFSFVAAILLRTRSPSRLLGLSFAGCAAAALLTLTNEHLLSFYAAAFLIGSFAGMVTVTLAGGLRNWIKGSRFGLHVGIGTGVAYLICNMPFLFDASPFGQTVFSALLCLPGIAFTLRRAADETPDEWIPSLSAAQFRGMGFVSIVLMFLALVWLDSTAFATIQLTEDLRSHTWGTPAMKIMLGIFHALAAVAAGWLIDRKQMRSLLLGTFGLFAMAFTLLQSNTMASWLSGPLYACGISIYSTALVAFPSLRKNEPGLVPVRWRAAIIYAVAGWIGSGLGVGLAQHLHAIPAWLLLVAGLMIGIGGLFPLNESRRQFVGRYACVALAGVGACVYFTWAPLDAKVAGLPPSIMMGREVYRQEGCINCHSQYLRPGSPDIVRWGPYRPINRTEKPPFVGNRRQGPDLMNAGLRRTEVWHRQHLIAPASLSPGSKMPSYAHLFRAGDPRGEALVMYLGSLGISNVAQRVADNQQWSPMNSDGVASKARGRDTFQLYCSMCHGKEGNGDGPLAPLFFRPAMQLTKGAFQYVPASLDEPSRDIALARIIKFGLPGLHMPGHETFSDDDILDVVAFVRTVTGQKAGLP